MTTHIFVIISCYEMYLGTYIWNFSCIYRMCYALECLLSTLNLNFGNISEMNSLRSLAEKAIPPLRIQVRENDPTNQSQQELIIQLKDEIASQRLHIMEIEENAGATAQENAWLYQEVANLKVQILELENMIYGYSRGLVYKFIYSSL